MRIPAWLNPLLAPAGILLAATLAFAYAPSLPPSLAGLRDLGPYVVIAIAGAVAFWFNRGRAFVLAASLLVAYGALHAAGRYAGFTPVAVYSAIVILVPLNALGALLLPERGVSHHRNYRWLLIVVLELILIVWIAAAGRSPLSGSVWHAVLEHPLLKSPPTPWLGRILFAAAFATAAWRAWPRNGPLDVGLAAALAAFFIACEWARTPGAFGAFISTAGLVLVVALLQESHRMAFGDELTGLPARRALEEALASLGPNYAIAMIDVDHFKQFNDTHGHDVGDQVLKLVGGQLALVGGGGRAFRYGGEEFSVLFANGNVREALPHLEKVRKAIEGYGMAVRRDDRPPNIKEGAVRRGKGEVETVLSVTVSIGVAGPDAGFGTPDKVIRAADEALYRAKKTGRNRVSL
ncbi:MAG TPA: GGDEF domain-containing protein [Burkholderiales bacterium]|nr:GGDEF domain-containing protein [Burkholderiales bacterium]